MEMRNGMLGVVIVALALTGALFGGYLAGAHAETHDVTKYNYLADISGLFEYDQSPQYISFDPSSNYTGYYSNDSYSLYLNGYYFDQDKVGFVQSSTVNNYKIIQNDDVSAESTVDLGTLTLTNVGHLNVRYNYIDDGSTSVIWSGRPAALSTVIEQLGYSPSNMTLRITLGEVDWDHDSANIDLDSILIIPSAWFTEGVGYDRAAFICDPNFGETEGYHIPYQSFEVDLATGNAKCYYNADFTGWDLKTWKTDNLYVCYGDDDGSTIADVLDLGSDITYWTITHPQAIYLNPNNGVWLKEAEA